jgi:iron-sulfur cluster repair protein YtfE (RIC family)
VALRLKKGGPASPHDRGWPTKEIEQADALAKFAREELFPHFMLEEEIVFPAFAGNANVELKAAVSQVLEEHKIMRDLLATIELKKTGFFSDMKRFGGILERHIRFEERTLFPLAEAEIGKGAISLPKEEIEARHTAYLSPPACEN